MQIVRASNEDLEDVAELFDAYRQFYRQPPDRDRARQFIRRRMDAGESIVFLARDSDSTALGFTQLYPSFCSVAAGRILVLYDLFVAESARRRGVGRGLLERARELAEEMGAVRMDLATAIDNRRAQSLYESLNWQRDEEFYHYSLDI